MAHHQDWIERGRKAFAELNRGSARGKATKLSEEGTKGNQASGAPKGLEQSSGVPRRGVVWQGKRGG